MNSARYTLYNVQCILYNITRSTYRCNYIIGIVKFPQFHLLNTLKYTHSPLYNPLTHQHTNPLIHHSLPTLRSTHSPLYNPLTHQHTNPLIHHSLPTLKSTILLLHNSLTHQHTYPLIHTLRSTLHSITHSPFSNPLTTHS